MALSAGMRNRIVGFTIVITSIVILLPLILSKDMIKRPDPNAIAINQEGAVVDKDGNLQYQSEPDLNSALNINGQNGELQLSNNANSGISPTIPEQQTQEIESDNSVEMLDFSNPSNHGEELIASNSKPTQNNSPFANKPKVETLEAKPKPSAPVPEKKPEVSKPKEEVLVAKPKPAAPSKPKEEILVANKPSPAPSAQASSSSGPKIVSGTKPSGKFVVQVGVFSKRANADNVVAKIKALGINVYMVEVNTNGRIFYRIFAGSAQNRTDLNETLKKIDAACATKGKIVPI